MANRLQPSIYLAVCLLMGAAAHGVRAQIDEAGEQQDELDARIATPDEPLEPVRPAGSSEPIAPAATGLPGIELPSFRPKRADLVREGAFIVDRRGYVHTLVGGGMVFVFDKDAQGKAEVPMILLPCLRLGEMKRIIESRDEQLTFSVNGEVFVYRGRNYLLPDFFRIVRPESSENEGEEPAAEEADSADAMQDTAEDEPSLFEEDGAPGPSVEELVAEIESASREAGEVFQPVVSEDSEALGLREGAVIVRSRGRVRRGDGGSWVFAPENDTEDTPAAGEFSDAPLVMLPSLNLQRLEQLTERSGGSMRAIVSGVVTVYDGRNYMLPTSFRLEAASDSDLSSGR